MKVERIILGAGIYGLYAAVRSAEKGYQTLVIDMEKEPFMRGSYINQARLHNGYHYPRSLMTASKSAGYFKRFVEDFGEACNNMSFQQIYAIAQNYSWTNSKQFQRFSKTLGVQCDKIDKSKYFNPVTVEDAFLTKEYSFDAAKVRDKLFNQAKALGVIFQMGERISQIRKEKEQFVIELESEATFESGFVLNATYAGVNQIHRMLGYEMLPIKYELCEVILCDVPEELKDVGLTVMDGPFFSVMPFGKTGVHSITTVSRTPHVTCYDPLPEFSCQKKRTDCTPDCTANCNSCPVRPESAFIEMRQIAKLYLKDSIDIQYRESLFTLKPILKASEIDDSRPTIIRQYSEGPDFYTVFSGKINTMYDLDSIL